MSARRLLSATGAASGNHWLIAPFQENTYHFLHQLVVPRRNAKRPCLRPVGFGDIDPARGLKAVAPLSKQRHDLGHSCHGASIHRDRIHAFRRGPVLGMEIGIGLQLQRWTLHEATEVFHPLSLLRELSHGDQPLHDSGGQPPHTLVFGGVGSRRRLSPFPRDRGRSRVVSIHLSPCRYGARAICSPHYRATRSYGDSVTIQVQASRLVTCTGHPTFAREQRHSVGRLPVRPFHPPDGGHAGKAGSRAQQSNDRDFPERPFSYHWPLPRIKP
jgi:hypothetical protein